MRVSEALAMRLLDMTSYGLIIAQTKFKKSRLCHCIRRCDTLLTDMPQRA